MINNRMRARVQARAREAYSRAETNSVRGARLLVRLRGPSPFGRVSIPGLAPGRRHSAVWTSASRVVRRLRRIFRQLDASRRPTGISRYPSLVTKHVDVVDGSTGSDVTRVNFENLS